jgi:GTP cyclohydrolase III
VALRTARRRIKAAGLFNCVAARKPLLTVQHKGIRIGSALQYLGGDNDLWSRVVFSDEKVFQSTNNDRMRVGIQGDSKISLEKTR